MRTWGNLPWQNDAAADWFAETFNSTKLASHAEETLQLEAEEAHEEIRAAASIVLLLCHNFVWPPEAMDWHLELAASRLEELMKMEEYSGDPEIIATMEAEVKTLRARLSKKSKSKPPKWWCYDS